MPLVEIKLIEGELSKAQSQELIQKVTNVVASSVGENLRPVTWVVVHEVKSGYWGLEAKRWVSMTSGRCRKANPRPEA